jgi:hypothetical protein
MGATGSAISFLGYAYRLKLAIRMREKSQGIDIEGRPNHNT